MAGFRISKALNSPDTGGTKGRKGEHKIMTIDYSTLSNEVPTGRSTSKM